MNLLTLITAVVILASQANARKLETGSSIQYLEEEGTSVGAVSPDKIKFNFFRKGLTSGIELTVNTVEGLVNKDHDPSLDTVYVIHGWTNNDDSSINTKIKNALLQNHDVNIFIVDWSRYSRLDYISAKNKVQQVGQVIGDFISQTVILFNVDLNKVRLVGFSLGAHVAGSAGNSLNGALASIIGLDPAGPGFDETKPETRLSTADAQYVQAIHTNAGLLGCDFSVGHSDFWPNGGKKQPNCILDLAGICSHNRVFVLYSESLGTNGFISTRCISYSDYSEGLCDNEESAKMGGLQPNTQANGNYYLDTNGNSPYGKN